ncbi:hypothetical protein AN216_16710 [Streptomyces oceani]|uniref:Uncharacterized protein n=1 Tax=Streptomyces oceani TaxID=1075402 RepID=A0A1E7KD32_9ACTN|nr:hypothetical protein AN216_16710 [Streptomyces oceani]
MIVLLAGGCGDSEDGNERARERVGEVLDRRAVAVRNNDLHGYLAVVDPGSGQQRDHQREVFQNLRRLPLAHWSYHVTDLELREDGLAYTQVRLRYQLRGFDPEPVTATEELVFTHRDGDWYLVTERPGSPRQLWEQGRMSVHQGSHGLVLSADDGDAANVVTARMLRRVGAAADVAVPVVAERWPRGWARSVVVEVPGTLYGVGQRLGTSAESYEGIAALTLGKGKGKGGRPADRIVVNPEAYGELSDTGQQVVMTHETTHVATRKHTSDATPMWLSEGLGDWFGYLGSGRSPRTAAPKLTSAVRDGRVPERLPSDRQFAYDAGAETLGMAYEGSWLACRMIAEEWGEERLMEFYRKVGGKSDDQRAAVEAALGDVLGLDRAEFTARWRDYLRSELG